MRLDTKVLTSLVMFGLFSSALLLSLWLPSQAAFLPYIIGIPGAILCGFQVVIDLRNRAVREVVDVPEKEEPKDESAKTEAEMFLWLGIYTTLLMSVGFVIGGPIAVSLYIYFGCRDGAKNALFSGVGTLFVIYGIFERLLGLTLFQGLLIEKFF
ncbi:MAG: tripartite tricarboxylate transporter TctB family protein [Rhodobacteraceae bacterium]|nr:tripartite tricarboxylate transporter TctB family protein [Paracoccaceae bacterium]